MRDWQPYLLGQSWFSQNRNTRTIPEKLTAKNATPALTDCVRENAKFKRFSLRSFPKSIGTMCELGSSKGLSDINLRKPIGLISSSSKFEDPFCQPLVYLSRRSPDGKRQTLRMNGHIHLENPFQTAAPAGCQRLARARFMAEFRCNPPVSVGLCDPRLLL